MLIINLNQLTQSKMEAHFPFACKVKSPNDPDLVPMEEVYIKVFKVTL